MKMTLALLVFLFMGFGRTALCDIDDGSLQWHKEADFTENGIRYHAESDHGDDQEQEMIEFTFKAYDVSTNALIYDLDLHPFLPKIDCGRWNSIDVFVGNSKYVMFRCQRYYVESGPLKVLVYDVTKKTFASYVEQDISGPIPQCRTVEIPDNRLLTVHTAKHTNGEGQSFQYGLFQFNFDDGSIERTFPCQANGYEFRGAPHEINGVGIQFFARSKYPFGGLVGFEPQTLKPIWQESENFELRYQRQLTGSLLFANSDVRDLNGDGINGMRLMGFDTSTGQANWKMDNIGYAILDFLNDSKLNLLYNYETAKYELSYEFDFVAGTFRWKTPLPFPRGDLGIVCRNNNFHHHFMSCTQNNQGFTVERQDKPGSVKFRIKTEACAFDYEYDEATGKLSLFDDINGCGHKN